MTFSLDGGTITQSGTDADLSGLSGIAGVTVTQVGAGATGKTIYDIGALLVVIDGTLSHDPDVEVLIGSAQNMLRVSEGGTYNYGVARVKNGQTMYSESTGLISTFVSGNVFSQNGLIFAGNFNWNGGDIEYASVISIPATGVINQNAGGLIHKNPTQSNQIRIATGAVTNFNDIRISAPNAETPRFFNFDAFDTLVFTPVNAAFQTFTQFISADVVLRDYANGENAADSDVVWNGQSEAGIYRVQYINVERFVSAQPGTPNLAGLVSTYKDYTFRTEGIAGNGLEGAVIYYAEQDDGNAEVVNIYDLTAIESFAIETGATGDVQATPLVVNTYKKHGNTFSVVTNKRYNANDTIPLQVWRYDRLPTSLAVPYYGEAGPSEVSIVMFDDPLVTLSEAAAAALTEVNTLDDLYDAAKYWKTRAQTERIEYPAPDTQLASAAGVALDLNGTSLVVDENASDAFSVDISADTITIKSANLQAGEKFSSILTTGTATGAIDVPIVDANGDSFVEEAEGNLIRVYATEADRECRENALADLVSRYRFTFASRPANTLFLWVQIGVAEFPTQITLSQGKNIVDLGIQSQLISLQAAVGAPLQAGDYIAPDNATIGDISTKVQTLQNTDLTGVATSAEVQNRPTLAEMEASAALTAVADVSGLATETSVTALGTPLQSGDYIVPPSLADIEGSTVLAKESTVAAIGTPLQAGDYTAPPTSTDNATAVWGATARALTDKDGFGLSASERNSIAVAVEAALIDDDDGQALLDAIVQAIGNQNVDEIALVAAIRADLERNGGRSDQTLRAAKLAAALSA